MMASISVYDLKSNHIEIWNIKKSVYYTSADWFIYFYPTEYLIVC